MKEKTRENGVYVVAEGRRVGQRGSRIVIIVTGMNDYLWKLIKSLKDMTESGRSFANSMD